MITAVIGAAMIFAAVILGGYWLAVLFAMIAAVSTLEIGAMMKVPMWSIEQAVAVVCTVLMVIWPPFERFWYILFYLLLALTIVRRKEFSFAGAGVLFAGALYSSYAFRTLLNLRHLAYGFTWVLLVFLSIWATDTGAFFVGRAFGGRKLLPEVSPKKTVSGAIGGFLLAVIVAVLFGVWSVGRGTYLWWQFAVVGAVISVFGQIGDLVESALKRNYMVKDSGWILPGHGGVLDRFDSLLLAAPIAYHLIIGLFK